MFGSLNSSCSLRMKLDLQHQALPFLMLRQPPKRVAAFSLVQQETISVFTAMSEQHEPYLTKQEGLVLPWAA